MEKTKIKVVNTSGKELPMYQTEGSVGMDLHAVIRSEFTKCISDCFIHALPNTPPIIIIKPMGRLVIDTGIKIQLPQGWEAQVRNRSGLTARNGIVAQFGTIDSDYRGNIMVTLINFGKEKFVVEDGSRIAQLVFKKVELIEWEECESLEDTERGDGGHGHTGA